MRFAYAMGWSEAISLSLFFKSFSIVIWIKSHASSSLLVVSTMAYPMSFLLRSFINSLKGMSILCLIAVFELSLASASIKLFKYIYLPFNDVERQMLQFFCVLF